MPPAELAAWLNLAMLAVGIGLVLIRIGGRDAALRSNTKAIEELHQIVQDLVRFQIAHETSAEHTKQSLDEIRRRLDRLEASGWEKAR
jgi:predicted nucleotide-binding protein (sugar kinase/HSP70/actin superfamily)